MRFDAYELAHTFLRSAAKDYEDQTLYMRRAGLGVGWVWGAQPPKAGLWTPVTSVTAVDAEAVVSGVRGSLSTFWRVLNAIELAVENEV